MSSWRAVAFISGSSTAAWRYRASDPTTAARATLVADRYLLFALRPCNDGDRYEGAGAHIGDIPLIAVDCLESVPRCDPALNRLPRSRSLDTSRAESRTISSHVSDKCPRPKVGTHSLPSRFSAGSGPTGGIGSMRQCANVPRAESCETRMIPGGAGTATLPRRQRDGQ